jgi:hypothetical protein
LVGGDVVDGVCGNLTESMTIFETSAPFRRLARRRSLNLGAPTVALGDDLPLRFR